MEVGFFDRIRIHQTDGAHPGRGQVGRGRAAKSANADDQDRAGLELQLAWFFFPTSRCQVEGS